MKLTLPKINDIWQAHNRDDFNKLITDLSLNIKFNYIDQSAGCSTRDFSEFFFMIINGYWKRI